MISYGVKHRCFNQGIYSTLVSKIHYKRKIRFVDAANDVVGANINDIHKIDVVRKHKHIVHIVACQLEFLGVEILDANLDHLYRKMSEGGLRRCGTLSKQAGEVLTLGRQDKLVRLHYVAIFVFYDEIIKLFFSFSLVVGFDVVTIVSSPDLDLHVEFCGWCPRVRIQQHVTVLDHIKKTCDVILAPAHVNLIDDCERRSCAVLVCFCCIRESLNI